MVWAETNNELINLSRAERPAFSIQAPTNRSAVEENMIASLRARIGHRLVRAIGNACVQRAEQPQVAFASVEPVAFEITHLGEDAGLDQRANRLTGGRFADRQQERYPQAWSRLTSWLRRISPADHADLRVSLRLGSTWGSDFVGMLGLASAIATLGLLQDVPAVVIGSMLPAPLMTPFDRAWPDGRTGGRATCATLREIHRAGFHAHPGCELSDSCARPPDRRDWGGGDLCHGAAKPLWCRCRGGDRHCPGAAGLLYRYLACCRGMAERLWRYATFFTNLVAIIVLSSFTFSFLGVMAARTVLRHRRRALLVRAGLVTLLLAITGPLSTALLSQLEEGKNVAAAYPVTRVVEKALYEQVSQDEGVEIMLLERERGENRVLINIASLRELPKSYADQLTEIVRDKMENPDVSVGVVAVRGL